MLSLQLNKKRRKQAPALLFQILRVAQNELFYKSASQTRNYSLFIILYSLFIKIKNAHPIGWTLWFVSALPIFPGRFQPSIFGANELNYCVRDGNRWTLIAINTDSRNCSSRERKRYSNRTEHKLQVFFSFFLQNF